MIQLYAGYRETLEKQSMGFRMSDWDSKLLKYGERFEKRDDGPVRQHPARGGARPRAGRSWPTASSPMETGIHTELIEKFWPK